MAPGLGLRATHDLITGTTQPPDQILSSADGHFELLRDLFNGRAHLPRDHFESRRQRLLAPLGVDLGLVSPGLLLTRSLLFARCFRNLRSLWRARLLHFLRRILQKIL